MWTKQFLEERIEKTKELIIAYEDAILALGSSGGIEEYRLDTGQSVQTVKRSDLDHLQAILDNLYSRLDVFCARLTRRGVVTVRPAF